MYSAIILSAAAFLFLWGGQRLIDDRLREKERLRGRERKSFFDSLSAAYPSAGVSDKEEAFFYVLQALFFFIWLVSSILAWGLLDTNNALVLMLSLLFLTLGAPRMWKIRKNRHYMATLKSEIPLISFFLVLVSDRVNNPTSVFASLTESLKTAKIEPVLTKGIKRIESRLRYGMRSHKALVRFAEELGAEPARGFSEVVTRHLSEIKSNDLAKEAVGLKLFSREREAIYETGEELRSRVCFILSSFLLIAVILTSVITIVI